MVDGKGRAKIASLVGETMKGMLRVVKYCEDKLFSLWLSASYMYKTVWMDAP